MDYIYKQEDADQAVKDGKSVKRVGPGIWSVLTPEEAMKAQGVADEVNARVRSNAGLPETIG